MNEHTQTTHHDSLINLLFEDGLENAIPRIAEILMNTAMLLEREQHIGASPYQRGVERDGYANRLQTSQVPDRSWSIRVVRPPRLGKAPQPFPHPYWKKARAVTELLNPL
jgi:hypothetical protein